MESTTNTAVSAVQLSNLAETLDDAAVVATAFDINQQLRNMGLWKAGCQFLSKDDKLKLMTSNKAAQDKIYKRVQQIIHDIQENAKNKEYKYVFSEKSVANGVNIFGDIEQLKGFVTPVHEDKVYFSNGVDLIPAPKHKSIVDKDGHIVSVMNAGYKLIRNEDVILPLLEQLDKYDSKWYIDDSHSFIDRTKMRMQITFPDLIFNDGTSDVAMSLYVTNSYDGSSSVKAIWGAIRNVCSNGMIWGNLFAKYSQKHTSHFAIDNLIEQIHETQNLIPVLSERIRVLSNLEFVGMGDEIAGKISHLFGRKALAYVEQENGENKDQINSQYDFLNVLTYYISHYVNYKTRAIYQSRLSTFMDI